MAERPDWQPISRPPLIGSMIDAMLQDAEEHYQTTLGTVQILELLEIKVIQKMRISWMFIFDHAREMSG